MSNSLIPSFLVSDVSESLKSLTKNERCEQIAQVAHQKWATMSNSLRLLTKNERPWTNRSGRSPKMSESLVFWANRSLAHFFSKNKRFTQKTIVRIPSPGFKKYLEKTRGGVDAPSEKKSLMLWATCGKWQRIRTDCVVARRFWNKGDGGGGGEGSTPRKS